MKTKDWTFLGVVGLAILALGGLVGFAILGGFGTASEPVGVRESGSNNSLSDIGTASRESDATKAIKVSARGDGLPQKALDQIAQLENVSDARGYLTVTSGQTQILGVDTSKPLVIEADGKLVEPSVVEGRLLEPNDAGQPVMIAGKIFAENNETDFGYPILGMAGHGAPFSLDDKQLTILGVYETGSKGADDQIVLPLDTAQQLYGKADRVNVVYVTVNDPANSSSVIDQVKQIVGKKATVEGLGE